MPVSTTPSDGFSSGSATSLTFSHTSDTNPLYVLLSWFIGSGGTEAADIVTGVTFDGVALTRGGHAAVAGNTMEWWRLGSPSSGAHDVVITLSAGRRITAAALNLTGWPSDPADHAFAAAGADVSPPSVVVDSIDAAEVLSFISWNDPANDITEPGGSTALWSQEGEGGGLGPGGDQVSAGCLLDGAFPTVTVSWSGTVVLEFYGVAALSFITTSTSQRNLLTGSGHTVEGSDNVITGTNGTVTGQRNVLHALCDGSPAPSITGDNTFEVCADVIRLTAPTVEVNGSPIGSGGALDDLSDVVITTPTTGQVLTYDGADWINDDLPSGSGGSTSTGAEGSEPGSPSAGDLYLPNNGFWIKRYSGSAWVPWGPIFPLTNPALAGLSTWINQGSATSVTTNGGIAVSLPAGSGVNERLLVKTAPSTPYTITAAFLPRFNPRGAATAPHFGLAFRQSSDGKLAVFAVYPSLSGTSGLYTSSKYTDATTFSAHYVSVTQPVPIQGLVWLRIADDGSNRICSISGDGQHFLTAAFHSVGRTDFLTADQVGIVGATGDANFDHGFTLISWKEA